MRYYVDCNNRARVVYFGSLTQANIFALREIMNTDAINVWVLSIKKQEYRTYVKLKIKRCTE